MISRTYCTRSGRKHNTITTSPSLCSIVTSTRVPGFTLPYFEGSPRGQNCGQADPSGVRRITANFGSCPRSANTASPGSNEPGHLLCLLMSDSKRAAKVKAHSAWGGIPMACKAASKEFQAAAASGSKAQARRNASAARLASPVPSKAKPKFR